MDPEEKRRKRDKRYTIRVYLRRKEEWRSGKKVPRGERRGVGPRMKRKETTLGGYTGESVAPKRSTEGDGISKRCDVMSRVSSEDTISSGSRVIKYESMSPWLLRDFVTSKEEEV
jgi:hypothetical protein